MATVTVPFTLFSAELNFADFLTKQDANAIFYKALGVAAMYKIYVMPNDDLSA